MIPDEEGLPASLLRRLGQLDGHARVGVLSQVGHHNAVTHPTYTPQNGFLNTVVSFPRTSRRRGLASLAWSSDSARCAHSALSPRLPSLLSPTQIPATPLPSLGCL